MRVRNRKRRTKRRHQQRTHALAGCGPCSAYNAPNRRIGDKWYRTEREKRVRVGKPRGGGELACWWTYPPFGGIPLARQRLQVLPFVSKRGAPPHLTPGSITAFPIVGAVYESRFVCAGGRSDTRAPLLTLPTAHTACRSRARASAAGSPLTTARPPQPPPRTAARAS